MCPPEFFGDETARADRPPLRLGFAEPPCRGEPRVSPVLRTPRSTGWRKGASLLPPTLSPGSFRRRAAGAPCRALRRGERWLGEAETEWGKAVLKREVAE